MPDSSSAAPAVSIILPTYNRARFLGAAFAAIGAQTLPSWELIVVDDGSTDDTRDTVEAFRSRCGQRVVYHFQANRGPAVARNEGLRFLRGAHVAFFDSDDLWLPHHLDQSVRELNANPDVDWIFAPTRVVSLPEGKVIQANSFFEGNRPGRFLRVRTEKRGALNILRDQRAVELALTHGFDAPLQTSVLRASVFDQCRLPPYRVGEDRVFLILALTRGFRVGYLMDVHVIYHRHAGNICLGSTKEIRARIAKMDEFIRAHEYLRGTADLTRREKAALDRRLSREYFWNMGYPLAQQGLFVEALQMFRKGMRLAPGNIGFWKTYLLTWLRKIIGTRRGDGEIGAGVAACKTGHQEG